MTQENFTERSNTEIYHEVSSSSYYSSGSSNKNIKIKLYKGSSCVLISPDNSTKVTIKHSDGNLDFDLSGSAFINSAIHSELYINLSSASSVYLGQYKEGSMAQFLLPNCPIGNTDIKVFKNSKDSMLQLYVTELRDLNKKCPLCSLRLSHKLKEVFIRHLELLGLEGKENINGISENHIKSIIKAKNIIEADLSTNFTIQNLAKLSGTNEQYLKKYFKALYGKTIQKYTMSVKMNYARELIKSQDIKMSEVAESIGYKHATHFTAAFKRHFGYVPHKLK